MSQEPYHVPAVQRATRILWLLAERSAPATLADVLQGAEMNKSTVFYLLRTLVAERLVHYDESARTYTLGEALIELAAAASEQNDRISALRRALDDISPSVDATLVVYRHAGDDEVVLIHKIERLGTIRITVPLGSRLPIQGGSFGRAFLAFESHGVVDKLLTKGLRRFTKKSVLDPDAFLSDLERVRRRGWAVDHEGFALGVSTVAAPVFEDDGHVELVVGLVSFTSRLDEATVAGYGALLRELCDRMGRPFLPVPPALGAEGI